MGNKLPDPITIFAGLTGLSIIASIIFAYLGLGVTYEAVDRSTGEIVEKTVQVKSLLTKEAINYIFSSSIKNFVGFYGFGVVLVAMLGVGVADGSGYISAILKKIVLYSPKKWITPIVIFAGVISNITVMAGYVILIPLGGIIFASFGKHPIAGIAAAFAGVSGGFSANLLITPLEPLLGGISTGSARILDPNIVVSPTDNLYFLIISNFLITIIGTYITEKVVIPMLGEYKGGGEVNKDQFILTEDEKRGLKMANLSAVLTIAIFAYLAVDMGMPLSGVLVGDKPFLSSTFMSADAFVLIISILFFIVGLVYGKVSKKFKTDRDVISEMTKAISIMSGYIVLVFIAAQFMNYFFYSQLGTVIVVLGAEFLSSMNIVGTPLFVIFILITALINLFIGSASAKWAIMAPIFVPLFMKMGYDPAWTQLAYRISDSSTNIITPLMPYFPVVVVLAKIYEDKNNPVGAGTLMSVMLPYSISFLIGWIILFITWMLLGLPIGPGVSLEYG